MTTYFEYLPQEMLIEVSKYLDRQSLINFIKAHVVSEYAFMYYKLAGIYNDKIKNRIRIKKCILNRFINSPAYVNNAYSLDISFFDTNTCRGVIINQYPILPKGFISLIPGIVTQISRYEEFKAIFDVDEITTKDLYISNFSCCIC